MGAASVPFGRYLLGERLATGGMGEVYIAEQLGLGRFRKPIALKLLLPHLSDEPEAVEMFLNEAHLAARMSHPNVAQILDVGRVDGRYFIAMELVVGVSGSQLIRALAQSGQKLSPAALTYLSRSLAAGLEHAHGQLDERGQQLELVHRDVTPHNVLLSQTGEAKLTDFGIAKARMTASTRPGTFKGKFDYMAPEQFSGKRVDARADMFGWAVTVFHLATLSAPFRRDSDALTISAVGSEPLPDLARLVPELPQALCDAVHRAASKQPEQRFESMREVLEALPPVATEGPAELAGTVRRVCARELWAIEEKTRHLRHPSSSRVTGTMSAGPGARRWAWALSLAFVLVLVLVALRLRKESSSPLERARLAEDSKGKTSAQESGPEKAPAANTPTAEQKTGSSPKLEPAKTSSAGAPSPNAASEALLPLGPKPHTRAANSPFAASGPPAGAPTKPHRPAGSGRVGYVTIDAVPWAQVSIDGKNIGETPINEYPVPAGSVHLSLTNPTTKKKVQRHIRVGADKRVFVKEDLQ